MIITYLVQKKENFTRKLESKAIRKCGVSILTNQKVLIVAYQAFNYFGMHNLTSMLLFVIDRCHSSDPRVFIENRERGT